MNYQKKISQPGYSFSESGATAVVCLLIGDTLYTANSGDARAVLCREGQAVRLSVDHKPLFAVEERRIRSNGGFVTTDGRVMGRLAVSRAFGDSELITFITVDPTISVTRLTPKDEFVILGCDGVWDVISDRMAVAICGPASTTPHRAAMKLRDIAYFCGSTDNISVMFVSLQPTAHNPLAQSMRLLYDK